MFRIRALTLLASAILSISAAVPAAAHARGLNNPKAGVTGIAQAPVDVVWHVIYPPDDFVYEFPAGEVTGRFVGLFSGPVLAAYRLTMGVTDLVFTPFWVLPVMSPEPRWEWFEDVEYWE